MILTVYGRFFKLYMATAIAPIPLSSFAGQPSSSIGMAFIKSYAAICHASKNGRKKARKSLKLLGFSQRHLFWCSLMEQGTGVEPASAAWEAAVLPMYEPCIFSSWVS